MKLHYSIGIATKIILMVTTIIVASIGVVVFIASDLFQDESVTRVQMVNATTASIVADRVRSTFEDAKEKMSIMAQFAVEAQDPIEAERAIRGVLRRSENMLGFVAYQFDDHGNPISVISVADEVGLAEFHVKAADLAHQPLRWVTEAQREAGDSLAVVNISPLFQAPIVSVSFLSQRASKDSAAENKLEWTPEGLKGRWLFRGDLRADSLVGLSSDRRDYNVFLVDGKGRLLYHSDRAMKQASLKGSTLKELSIVQELMEGKLTNHQRDYQGLDGQTYLGSYKMVGVSGLGVVAEVPRKVALGAIEKVQYRSFLFMVAVVCLAFLINFAFSKSLVRPLKDLYSATARIVEGQYDVRVEAKSSDEIGALSRAFSNMAEGLKEREKIKTAFNKFHSKEIAKKLLSGEIKLGGEKRQATIFFSDIRGFTSLAESMTPDQTVGMLNEYMTEMVRIIEKWNGIVDKYIGDAIMAVWGVPETRPQDAYNAVRATLEMRDFLKEWNAARVKQGKLAIEIGIGLHTGEVLAGNIGSESRLEYTVIGDTVNQASRIEGANKPLHSDLLISDATWVLVKGQGIVAGPEVAITAKGKSQSLIVHKLIGFKEDGTLHTTLSESQVHQIENEKLQIETVNEEKTSIAGTRRIDPNPDPDSTAIRAAGGAANAAQAQPQNQMQNQQGYPPQMAPYPMPYPMMGVSPWGMMPPQMTMVTRPAMPQMAQQMASHMTPQPMHPNPSQAGAPAASQPILQTRPWFVVPSAQSTEVHGPYQPEEVRLFIGQGIYSFDSALCFQEGDPEMHPISRVPGLDRRGPRVASYVNKPSPPAPEVVESLRAPDVSEVIHEEAKMESEAESQTEYLARSEAKYDAESDSESEAEFVKEMEADSKVAPGVQQEGNLGAKLKLASEELESSISGEWFVNGPNDEPLGPFTVDQLNKMLGQGSISRTSFVWKEGLPDWQTLGDVADFNRRAA